MTGFVVQGHIYSVQSVKVRHEYKHEHTEELLYSRNTVEI